VKTDIQWIAHSFGKINLGLHVLEKLPSGYHQIETGFCFIEWNDRFEVHRAPRFKLQLSDTSVPADENNLITQAYRLFENEIGLEHAYHFKVDKHIPPGAGLGGGSSNAALTLRMLRKMEEKDIPDEQLIELGKKLGSDVPFFIRGETGIGTGTGTKISPCNIQPDAWIVTVYPNFESSTAEAYQFAEPAGEHEFSLKQVLLEDPIEEWRYLLQNDLETAVFPRHHLVGNIKDQFYDFGASFAAMSGSGSSVFGVFEQDFVAINAYESFHKLSFPANLTRPEFKPDLGIYIKETEGF